MLQAAYSPLYGLHAHSGTSAHLPVKRLLKASGRPVCGLYQGSLPYPVSLIVSALDFAFSPSPEKALVY